MYRNVFIGGLLASTALLGLAAWLDLRALWALALVGPVAGLGLYDMLQREHTILRNFPVLGHFRYAFEAVRPEIQQYFIESNVDAYPVERELRSIIYQRSKDELETQPFGTQRDVYRIGYEWASHVMMPASELELSQGAKPGHGGILPAVKVTPEIARIRGVPPHETVFSPPGHSAFSTPIELIEFIERLRELAGGKPVGFKLCVGRRSDLFSVCRAMIQLDTTPDFIAVDGGEGGTGAAPLEFTNSLGMPARDAWIFVHSTLRGAGLRDRIKLLASGKIMTGFHMARALALGADACYSARGFMFALGCIQALRCNNDTCPTGITTQHPARTVGLHVAEKAERVERFHRATVRGLLELLSAMGLEHPDRLQPGHIFRRGDDQSVHSYAELYDFLESGQLLASARKGSALEAEWDAARADRWSR